MSDIKQVDLPILEARRWSGAEWPSKRVSIVDSESGYALLINAQYVERDDVEEVIQEVVRRCNDYKQLQARVKELETALKKQAKAALSGMDAARAEGALRMEIAERLNAESRPELIESEREANAILTAEVERLEAENAELRIALKDRRVL